MTQSISAALAARKLGVGLNYVYGLLSVGKLQGKKVGSKWEVSASSVEAWLRKRNSNHKPVPG
jgi:excisionase family DNA binding protein